MTEETKFPEATYSQPLIMKEDIDGWFNRCMRDFPRTYSERVVLNGDEVYATKEMPEPVISWFNKWFSQFVEGA